MYCYIKVEANYSSLQGKSASLNCQNWYSVGYKIVQDVCVLRTWVWLHDALYVSEHVLRGHFNLVQLSTQTLKFRVILRDTLSLTRFLCHKLNREKVRL